MGRLKDQNVYLTGGASGLGLAIVEAFVREGARCTVLDRRGPHADDAEKLGDAVNFIQGDVRDYAAHEAAVKSAYDRNGKLDCFIANAGIWDFNRSLMSMDPQELRDGFAEIFEIDVLGYLLGRLLGHELRVRRRRRDRRRRPRARGVRREDRRGPEGRFLHRRI